jgi:hypothetical protein
MIGNVVTVSNSSNQVFIVQLIFILLINTGCTIEHQMSEHRTTERRTTQRRLLQHRITIH